MDSLYPFPPDGNPPMKRCTGPCGRTLPATTEYFHSKKSEKDGFQYWCKKCRSQRKVTPEKLDIGRQKTCTGPCGRVLPGTTDFFYRDKHAKDGLTPRCIHCLKSRANHKKPREGYKRCRKCKNEYPFTSEYWPTDNRRESGLVGPCKQCISHYHSDFYVKHRDKFLRQHHQYRVMHKEIGRAIENRRRARKLSSGGIYTPKQIQDQLKRQKCKCYYCQKKLKKSKGKYIYQIDHIVPLAKGGSNDMSNLVVACPFCNGSKGARLLHDWPKGGRLI